MLRRPSLNSLSDWLLPMSPRARLSVGRNSLVLGLVGPAQRVRDGGMSLPDCVRGQVCRLRLP